MKKTIFILIVILVMTFSFTGCRMAPSQDPGDTVAAEVFEPADTTAIHARNKISRAVVKDSADLFIVGEGSDRRHLQLISYPTRRDTSLYYKSRHVHVTGNADYGHIVRIGFSVRKGDSIVISVEEYKGV